MSNARGVNTEGVFKIGGGVENRKASTQLRNGQHSDASQASGNYSPPWRGESTVHDIRAGSDADVPTKELQRAELRESLFKTQDRVMHAQPVSASERPNDRSLGRPNGSFLQRLRQRF